MKSKTIVIVVLIAAFAVLVGAALFREMRREETTLKQSISGVVEVDHSLFAQGVADIVKTDRMALMLVDPDTRKPVAMSIISPLVPPQTIRIGQENAANGYPLKGSYLLVGITDKDGEIYRVSPGEVYGISPEPIALGSEQVKLTLDQPFRGSLFNEAPAMAARGGASSASPAAMPPVAGEPPDPKYTIRGTITVTPALKDKVEQSDHLVILLFDPDQARPMAFEVVPHAILPQPFFITLPPEARAQAKPGYVLHVVTDKDDSPFHSVEGELVGRSAKPIPLGTTDLTFELDQPYVR